MDAAVAAQVQAETALQLHVGTPTGHRRQPSGGTHSRQPSTDISHHRQPSSGFVPVKSERETLDVLMLEREACEGSESVESSSPRVCILHRY